MNNAIIILSWIVTGVCLGWVLIDILESIYR